MYIWFKYKITITKIWKATTAIESIFGKVHNYLLVSIVYQLHQKNAMLTVHKIAKQQS